MRQSWRAGIRFIINGLAALTVALSAAHAAPAPAAPAAVEAQSPAPKSGGGPPPAASAEVPPDYRLGPGDVLQIYVWRNPELSVSIPVRPDGKITTPLVEDLVAVGKTPSQLQRDIEVALSEYVLSPKVNVIVTASTSAASQVKVIGAVRAPQSVPYRAGMTALDAIIAVGGMNEFASGNNSKIIRKTSDGLEQTIKVRLKDIVKGKLKSNFALYAGDVIVVPETLF